MGMSEKVVLVTGAARGIGFAAAERFLREGACVAANDIDAAALAKAVASLASPNVLAVPGDVSDTAAVARMVDQALSAFGRIDVLVNNAAIVKLGRLAEFPEETWQRILDTNLTGYYRCAKAVLPHMTERGAGVIINLSSCSAITPHPDGCAYAASKAGILALTRSLAREVGRQGVRVVAVVPGWIATEGNRISAADQAWIEANTSLGRPGRPDEVAAAIAFLAGPDASYISGQAIMVEGGMV